MIIQLYSVIETLYQSNSWPIYTKDTKIFCKEVYPYYTHLILRILSTENVNLESVTFMKAQMIVKCELRGHNWVLLAHRLLCTVTLNWN